MKISVQFENCYGIKKLVHVFDFENGKTFALYSPNGVMKTSFAKTFKDIANNKESKDLIFPERATKRIVMDENKNLIPAENIFVIEPYNESFKSEKVSTLLVNAKLKGEYEKIHSGINEKKNHLTESLKPISGMKTGIEETISEVFTTYSNEFLKAVGRLKDEVFDGTPPVFEGILYKSIFSDKVEEFLGEKDVKEKIKEYISKYDELIEKSNFFKRGIFNHTNASTIAKNLKENGFFKAKHNVNLNSSQGAVVISTEKELEDVINKEKQEILANPDLLSIFNGLDKKFSANKELRDFREYLLQNIFIIPHLSNIQGFKQKIWISYLKLAKDQYKQLIEEYENGKKEIERIIEKAKEEVTEWSGVIDFFNKRFDVPFKLSVGNQDQVILNAQAPAVVFEFKDKDGNKTVKESELLSVLSTGEKRALYLLNIIFEVEARKKNSVETIFIVDDIADSFDYKNKYAIIEYLKDIADHGTFYQIILSHNYDFFRTVSCRLDMQREHKLNTDRTLNEIKIFEEKYQNNPFKHWKSKLESDPFMLIASIPFVRNIAEYTGDESIFLKLTSLLHFKSDSISITMKDLEGIFKTVVSSRALAA